MLCSPNTVLYTFMIETFVSQQKSEIFSSLAVCTYHKCLLSACRFCTFMHVTWNWIPKWSIIFSDFSLSYVQGLSVRMNVFLFLVLFCNVHLHHAYVIAFPCWAADSRCTSEGEGFRGCRMSSTTLNSCAWSISSYHVQSTTPTTFSWSGTWSDLLPCRP